MYIGIEIGGTKLQLGVGPGDGTLAGLWRGTVDVGAGGDGIRRQILAAVPELLATAQVESRALKGVGIGFGGPVDDATRSVIKSHQIAGWDGFPLADWIGESLKLPAVLGNDADVAGLAEALFGAGRGVSPVFYMTIGSGIGGGLIVKGEIQRGTGKGAAEIGHLKVRDPRTSDGRLETLENIASGWGIGQNAGMTAQEVGVAASRGDARAMEVLNNSLEALADAICAVVVLVCPQRVVIGGGVSLIGEEWFFKPLRQKVNERVFAPFAGLADIVQSSLGETVVVHGALALARQRLGG